MKQLKSPKSDAILSTLSPLDSDVLRYVSLSKKIEQLMECAEADNDSCVPIELVAEFFMLQEDLYRRTVKNHKEAN